MARHGPIGISDLDADTKNITEAVFEPRLRELSLGVDQIAQQTLQELQDSLDRINDALRNPQAFGEAKILLTADSGAVVARSSSDHHLTIGILPLLLERKRLVLSRIRELGGRNAEAALERLASGGNGSGNTQQEAAQALKQLRVAREATQEVVELDRDLVRQREMLALSERRAVLSERRARVWQSFLARESMASIAGGILLLLLAGSLIVAMFVGTATSEVVSNAFLVILGYFFGQSVGRDRAKRDDEPSSV